MYGQADSAVQIKNNPWEETRARREHGEAKENMEVCDHEANA